MLQAELDKYHIETGYIPLFVCIDITIDARGKQLNAEKAFGYIIHSFCKIYKFKSTASITMKFVFLSVYALSNKIR